MKSILIVTYHFPPDAGVGGRRLAKFARYLPEFGWRPTVLTVDPRHYARTDATPPPDGVDIERTAMLPTFESIYRRLKRLISRRKPTPAEAQPGEPAANSCGGSCLRDLALALMYLPDEFLPWVPNAVAAGMKLAAGRRFDAILTSSPPNSVHIAGAILREATGLPWLADFRDPWLNDARADHSRTRIARALNAPLERLALRRADRIVTVTDEMDRHYRRILPGLDERFGVVYNGYDRADFPREDAAPASGPLTITYIGSMYHSRDPRCLLEAVSGLIAAGDARPDELRIEFIGNCASTPSGPLAGIIEANGLRDIVEAIGWLPHDEAIARLRRADVALLLASKQKLQVPAKVFEYIAAGKPVLALTEPDGATGRLIERARCGIVVEQEDVNALAEALKTLLERRRAGEAVCRPDAEFVATLDARSRVERLAGILDAMAPV